MATNDWLPPTRSPITDLSSALSALDRVKDIIGDLRTLIETRSTDEDVSRVVYHLERVIRGEA